MDIVRKSLFDETCAVSWPVWVLLALGAVGAGKIAFNALGALYYLLGPKNNVKRYGSWALVTGGTDGIGLAFAKVLYRKGINVFIVGRNAEKLEAAKAEVLKFAPASKASIAGILADLDKGGYVEAITREIRDVEVGILINNAGLSYEHAEYLAELSEERIQSIINVNCTALTNVAKAVLPGMVSRRRGLIMNIGSAAGELSIGDPLYSVYSGSKAYVDRFSRSLNLEYKSKGIHTEVCVPYFVVSKMSRIRKASPMTPSAETFAECALARSGRGFISIPYAMHALQHFVLESMPTAIQSRIVLSHHLDVYKRAMKKKAAIAAGAEGKKEQ